MRLKCILYFLLLFSAAGIHAQSKKFDTTVKMGSEGFRVECSNKNEDRNDVTISTVGLQLKSSKPTFMVYGKVTKAFADDMTDDGRPDLVICVNGGDSGNIGSVVAISYNAEKNLDPVYFPDIYLDASIRDGYKGGDEYSALTGTLMRKFPIYLPGDAPGKPTGGVRVVQYKAMPDNNGRLSFKVLRWYDAKS